MPAPTAHSPDEHVILAATGDSVARCPHSNARIGSEIEWNLLGPRSPFNQRAKPLEPSSDLGRRPCIDQVGLADDR
jgi:hypothetical protein